MEKQEIKTELKRITDEFEAKEKTLVSGSMDTEIDRSLSGLWMLEQIKKLINNLK
ncbi:MAG TPA: hypothetical protein VGZ90_13395 [Puia sp.]|jgi:hypothetical protein|nr:hypothetical protein [Puia sp.]